MDGIVSSFSCVKGMRLLNNFCSLKIWNQFMGKIVGLYGKVYAWEINVCHYQSYRMRRKFVRQVTSEQISWELRPKPQINQKIALRGVLSSIKKGRKRSNNQIAITRKMKMKKPVEKNSEQITQTLKMPSKFMSNLSYHTRTKSSDH